MAYLSGKTSDHIHYSLLPKQYIIRGALSKICGLLSKQYITHGALSKICMLISPCFFFELSIVLITCFVLLYVIPIKVLVYMIFNYVL